MAMKGSKNKVAARRKALGTVPENILYVVLHGLITLVDVGRDGFLAYLLYRDDEHVYLYGDWLFEKEIPQPSLGLWPLEATLTNVIAFPAKDGENTLNPTQN